MPAKPRHATGDLVRRIFDALASRWSLSFRDAGTRGAFTPGLRLGELLGLTWERVDMSRGVIRLELTKSGRRRKVPLNDDSDRALVRL